MGEIMFKLVPPAIAWDGYEYVKPRSVYIVCETWDEVMSRANAWGSCLTYRSPSGRWVLKTIEY